ncbi:hypothetical protein [Candidatus Uabimicrobium amorphum]|uniref:Uncharacterized protein n=1 Tax=Uabimicrobium amorphum TaxID=2596890 RepID=A0A5S9F3T2_UABAM|nr:hypothetical protein [Candidatus Uabimicrobium amorphum]BBM83859.1 hypothetical protein UABAM_02214 [Candidatus Uabimicrobium amorphum]
MRTVLYANNQLSSYLRRNFVLCWQSERPVPVVTIDFGDGRVVKRTITGNAAHYVMDHHGNLLDVVPGIYGANAFQRVISGSLRLWSQLQNVSDFKREIIIETYHKVRLKNIRKSWSKDLRTLGIFANVNLKPSRESLAVRAAIRTKSKRGIELPVIRSVQVRKRSAQVHKITTLREKTSQNVWQQIARLHYRDAKLDRGSRSVIEWQNPIQITASKALVESPVARLIRSFEKSLAEDTMRNEYEFHAKIHQWFCDGEAQKGFGYMNERVFREIFLTPANKPLIDLGEAYTGLLGDGLNN